MQNRFRKLNKRFKTPDLDTEPTVQWISVPAKEFLCIWASLEDGNHLHRVDNRSLSDFMTHDLYIMTQTL